MYVSRIWHLLRQWLSLNPKCLWNGCSLAASVGRGRKVNFNGYLYNLRWKCTQCLLIYLFTNTPFSPFLSIPQVQCLPHAYVSTVPHAIHPSAQPASQRKRQVWLWAWCAQAVPEAAQPAAGPTLRAPVWAEQLQSQQCAQLPHHTGPYGGQTQTQRTGQSGRVSYRERQLHYWSVWREFGRLSHIIIWPLRLCRCTEYEWEGWCYHLL